MQPTVSLIAIIAFFLLIVAVSLLRLPYVPGRGFILFRALFPSWRFFENIAELPTLEFRLRMSNGESSDWLPALIRPKRSWTVLLFNPQGNLYLACQTLLQQFANDVAEVPPGKDDEFEGSVSFQLVKSLVLFQIERSNERTKAIAFQFRVGKLLQGASLETLDTFVISQVYTI